MVVGGVMVSSVLLKLCAGWSSPGLIGLSHTSAEPVTSRQDGSTQSGYALVADSVISARTAKPGGKAGQQGQATDALRRAQEQRPAADYDDYNQTPPDDEIPF